MTVSCTRTAPCSVQARSAFGRPARLAVRATSSKEQALKEMEAFKAGLGKKLTGEQGREGGEPKPNG